ncbi:MAG: ArsR family transcriptional regulator [Hyphomicrobiales bacterium]|nr:ArsR family transcriptional regulator [Hyphomicrobiales bacterium]MDE2115030.1 helix-turn-helix transcriptional regulator [Hyphomicrobiales bacterium]
MDENLIIMALAALAQPTRLAAFRLLVRHEPDGLAAGDLARALDVPHNTLSVHISLLARAGLVTGARHSRSIIYRANLAAFRALALDLVQDCCGGRPELCTPLLAELQGSEAGDCSTL